MRKYQQLVLLLLSCGSVAVLLMYKSENNRLRDVLSVMNFFGRSDTAILRKLENATKEDNQINLSHPLPLWQVIGENFHAYAAYWNRNELVAGGEVLTIVVGKRGAVVNFRCGILYDHGTREVKGKFRFQRVDKELEDANSDFTIYNFYCRLTRDFGQPENVLFTDLAGTTKSTHKVKLRYVRAQPDLNLHPQWVTVCVDMFNYNSSWARDERDLMQFFLHHHALGVEHFVVYNGDDLPQHIQQKAHHLGMYLYLQPYNFPYSTANATQRIRRLIETDCLMRNTHVSRFTLLLMPSEFFYPCAKLNDPDSLLRAMRHYAAEYKRFELGNFAVCMDEKNRLLMDNTQYDSEVHTPHKLFLYRPHVAISTAAAAAVPAPATDSATLPLSMALTHSYIRCNNVGKDGLHDWRNSLREEFMQNLQEIRNEVDAFV